MNKAILTLGIVFVVAIIIKLIQNYFIRKKQKRKKSLLKTQDITNILFNVSFLAAGIASIIISLGYGEPFFGKELALAQPVINFLAGVLFIWFAIRNIFYGGKV